MTDYRKGLPERPLRMQSLPINDKGYPVPWFVQYIDGKPDFRVIDPKKWISAVRHDLCWLCGQPLGTYKTFVAGPISGVNRTSGEPPSHHECADYAARACPFLTLPKAMRREAGMPEASRELPGVMIQRNPGVTMLWTTRHYWLFETDGGTLIQIGEPANVEWLSEGREATRAEVEESLRTGMGEVQKLADEEGAGERLARMVADFQQYLPI